MEIHLRTAVSSLSYLVVPESQTRCWGSRNVFDVWKKQEGGASLGNQSDLLICRQITESRTNLEHAVHPIRVSPHALPPSSVTQTSGLMFKATVVSQPVVPEPCPGDDVSRALPNNAHLA